MKVKKLNMNAADIGNNKNLNACGKFWLFHYYNKKKGTRIVTDKIKSQKQHIKIKRLSTDKHLYLLT